VGTTSLVGRERDIGEVADLLGQPGMRMLTLTGPGGIGKTRLALAVGERVHDRFAAGTVFVPLATVTQPEAALAGVGRALGVELGTGPPLQALVEHLGDGRWLLILDNLEQVVEIAFDLDQLLGRCPGLVILATSLTVLRLRAEREYPVLPLPLPADLPAVRLDELISQFPAIALFVDRARAVRYDFTLTEENISAVVAICRQLEGLPLAIELAAARIRLLEPDALLARLSRSLDALGTGMVDVPERQRTLRATVEWSAALLDADERSLLEIMGIFVDGWTIEALAEVADLDEERCLDLSEALTRHSLVKLDNTEVGPRCRILETIRSFVAEELAARPDAGEIARRHAEHYRALAERADLPLRSMDQAEWADRLEAEAGNLAAAVRWYLEHDTAPLPHLFRVLSLFWLLRDHLGEAREWVDQMLPGTASLDPEARAELLWTAGIITTDVGDDASMLGTRERLGPILEGVSDPYLYALGQLTMAGIAAILGDFDEALRAALVSVERLRAQNEPFWTAVAVLQAGFLEITVGRYDDALRHLSEVRATAQRSDNAWLATWSRAALANLAVIQGRLDQATELIEEAISLTLAAHSPRSLTLCLAAYARLKFAKGDPEGAAALVGAADSLRLRAGLRPWPTLRQGEIELVAQVRTALGTDRFNEAFAAGVRLNLHASLTTVDHGLPTVVLGSDPSSIPGRPSP
jgi:predicted ATPase